MEEDGQCPNEGEGGLGSRGGQTRSRGVTAGSLLCLEGQGTTAGSYPAVNRIIIILSLWVHYDSCVEIDINFFLRAKVACA